MGQRDDLPWKTMMTMIRSPLRDRTDQKKPEIELNIVVKTKKSIHPQQADHYGNFS
jgi:hypothetical protein